MVEGNSISLSINSCFEEDGKQESIMLNKFFPGFLQKIFDGYFLHKIGTTKWHHSLLTKRQECKDFLSACNSSKIRLRQSTIIIFVIKFQKEKRECEKIYYIITLFIIDSVAQNNNHMSLVNPYLL